MNTKPKKMLIALQMWEGDVAETARVARLLSDIQDGDPNLHADLLLVYRRDCKPRAELTSYCLSGFDQVHEYVTRRRETGFPAGPNGMWCDLMQYCLIQHKKGAWDYECILTTEGDAIPLCRNWAEVLLKEWHDAKALVVGCWMNSGEHSCGHINGNALFHPRISEMAAITSCPAHRAWDTEFALMFSRLGWKHTNAIVNRYQAKTITDAEMQEILDAGAAWLHGVKDDSARKWARRNLLQD
jgi:hypothetical protein